MASTVACLEDRELLLAGQMGAGDHTRERRVSGGVAGEQDEMVARHRSRVELTRPPSAGACAADRVVEPAPAPSQAKVGLGARHRDLQPDDGPDGREARRAGRIGLGLSSRLPEANRGVEAGVVGDGDRGKAEERGGRDELLGMAGPIEEAEVAVGVELAVIGAMGGHCPPC